MQRNLLSNRHFFARSTACSNRVWCGEGFGDLSKGFDAKSFRKTRKKAQNLKEVIDDVKQGKARPIDPKEAAQGRIDYATVKEFSDPDGKTIKLEDLKMQNIMTDATVDPTLPFYTRLGKTLELLQVHEVIVDRVDWVKQSIGELEVEEEHLLPFDQWEFDIERYGTMLSNVGRAHVVIEDMIAKVIEDTTKQKSEISIPKTNRRNFLELGDFDVSALSHISSETGLDRGPFLVNDFQNLAKYSPEVDIYDMVPEESVEKYEKYLDRVLDDALDAKEDEKRIIAFCKIIAHTYILRVMHFTSGSEIARAAFEPLELGIKKSLSAFEDYPDFVQDPVMEFIYDINAIGKLLNEDQKMWVFEELPEAFKMTSVFYAPLARDPKVIYYTKPDTFA